MAAKMSSSQIEERKKELLDKLKLKKSNGEDLRARAQYEIDRSFASQGMRYFGGYTQFLMAGGIDPVEISRQVKYPFEAYLNQLYEIGISGNSLDYADMITNFPKLMQNLNQRGKGYYRSLDSLERMLEEDGKLEESKIFNSQKIRQQLKKRRKEEIDDKNNSLRLKIKIYNSTSEYSRQELAEKGVDIQEDTILGSNLKKVLTKSERWSSTESLAQKLKVSSKPIREHFIYKIPEKVIVIDSNGIKSYFVENSAVDSYQPLSSTARRQDNSLHGLSRILNLSPSKIRFLRDSYGLDLNNNSAEIIKRIISANRVEIERMISLSETKTSWTLNDLERAGLPSAHFYWKGRKTGVRYSDIVISSEEIREYLQSGGMNISSFELNGLMQGDLFSTRQARMQLGLDLSQMQQIVEKLRKENANSCFTLRKREDSPRSQSYLTSNGIKIVESWDTRRELVLMDVLASVRSIIVPQVEIAEELDRMIPSNLIIPKDMHREVMKRYVSLKRSNESILQLNEFDVEKSRLQSVVSYMSNHDYAVLELAKKYSLDSLRRIISSTLPPSEQSNYVSESMQKVEFAFQETLRPLFIGFLKKRGLPDSFIPAMEEAVIKAVRKHDPETGSSLANYAVWWMRSAAYKSLKKRQNKFDNDMISLDAPIGEDGENNLGDFITDATQSVHSSVDTLAVSNEVGEMLESLGNLEREIISMRFGLNGHSPMTLEEIARNLGWGSKSKVLKVENKILTKLAKNPLAKKLIDYLH